jgi:hypothetical protein
MGVNEVNDRNVGVKYQALINASLLYFSENCISDKTRQAG